MKQRSTRHNYFLLVFLLLCSFLAKAQYTYVQPYTQAYVSHLFLNPAADFRMDGLKILLNYQNEQMQVEGAPQTANLSMSKTFSDSHFGMGFLLKSTSIVFEKTIDFTVRAGYRVELDRQVLSFGLRGGFHSFFIDKGEIVAANYQDPLLYSENEEYFLPRLGAGIFYEKTRSFAVGIYTNGFVNYSNFNDSLSVVSSFSSLKQIPFGAYADKTFAFDDAALKFFGTYQRYAEHTDLLGAGMEIQFNEVFQTNMTYVFNWSLRFGMRLLLANDYHLGISYEFYITELSRFSGGNAEISFGYKIFREQYKPMKPLRYN